MINFGEQYSARVKDEDIGKAGVFALKLENNNNTFEINPTVAERNADFIITVRDNAFIDYELYKVLSFKASIIYIDWPLRYTCIIKFMAISRSIINYNKFNCSSINSSWFTIINVVSLNSDCSPGSWSSYKSISVSAGYNIFKRYKR